MKLSLPVTPKFVLATRFCRLFGISGITILWWVFYRKPPIPESFDFDRRKMAVENPESLLSYEFKMEERIHSNQQTFLFLLGLLGCAATSFILGVFGMVTPWWVWTFPVTLPFALYVLAWIVEVLLPPYDRAYYDSPFEREAKMNRDNHDYEPTIFSVWRYFRRDRKFWEGRR
jgi:hypothetical protein